MREVLVICHYYHQYVNKDTTFGNHQYVNKDTTFEIYHNKYSPYGHHVIWAYKPYIFTENYQNTANFECEQGKQEGIYHKYGNQTI